MSVAKTLIALDAGTTGVTALLFDQDLRPLARSYREFPQSFPQPGWVEHAAADILGVADVVLAEILARPEAAAAVAIGITNQRETVFALDRSTGKALRPGIVWQDRRTAKRCMVLKEAGHADRVQRLTGLLLDPYFSATKIEWMLSADSNLARKAAAGEVLFATVDALLVAHLTGNTVHATDPTNASRTMLYDIDARCWSPELCDLFGVRVEWLPDVRPSNAEFGIYAAAGHEIPIRGVVGDQQAALFGQGCFDAGTFKTTYGTGSFLVLNTGSERVDSERGLLTTIAVARDGSPCYAVEGSVFVSGALVQWLRDQLEFFSDAAEVEALARQVEDAGGVVIVPAFAGLGAPHWDPDARGAILGLSRGSSRAHLARAALDAIAFQNAELVEILRAESGLAIDELRADGGAAQNTFLMQLQADVAGLAVLVPENVESTARGAAALAGLGASLWDDPETPAAMRDGFTRYESTTDANERERRMAPWHDAIARVRSR